MGLWSEITNAIQTAATQVVGSVDKLRASLDGVGKDLKALKTILAVPGPLRVIYVKENAVGLLFKIQLGKAGASDVVTHELSVKVGDADAIIKQYPTTSTESDELSGARDAALHVEQTDIDGSGNRSAVPAVIDAVLKDTFAPPTPGQLGVVVTGQDD